MGLYNPGPAQVTDIEAMVDSIGPGMAAIQAVTDLIPDSGAMTSIAQEATLAVPAVDSAANVNARDVIGNKTDPHDGSSLRALAHKMDDHMHKAQEVYPTLADGITLTTAAGDWALGVIVEIVPAGTIGSDFDIHEIIIEDVNTQDKTYELILYSGAGDTEIGRTRFAAGANKGGVPNVTMQTQLVAANSRIRGRLAIQDGGSKTAVVSIRYHIY